MFYVAKYFLFLERAEEKGECMEYAETIKLCHTLQPRLKRLLSLFCREDINVEVIPEGESFTNLSSNYIRISINADPDTPKDEYCLIAKFISYHEGSHRRWTNRTEGDKLVGLATDLARSIIEEDGFESQINYRDFVFYILNSLEDGRIENILVNEYKGIRKLRDWYRMRELNSVNIPDNYSPLLLFLSEVLSIATTGLHLPGFCDIYPDGTEEHKAIIDIIPNITGYVTSQSVAQGEHDYLKVVETITTLFKDSIKSHFHQMENKPLLLPDDVEQAIKEALEREAHQNNAGSSNEIPSNTNIIGILTDDIPNDPDNPSSVTPDVIIDLRTEKSKDQGEETPHSQGKEEESSGNTDQDKTDDNFNDANSNGKQPESVQGKSNELESSEDKNVPKSESDTEGGNVSPDISKDYLTAKIEKIQEELSRNESEEEEAETKRLQRQAKEKVDKAGSTDMTNEELAALSQAIGISSLNGIEINQMNYYPKIPCDMITKNRTRRARRKIEEYLKVTNYNIPGRYEGAFDINAASKFIIGRRDIFTKKNSPVESDACCMIIKDNSSSMDNHLGSKEEYAIQAISELEEMLKGIIPLKISTFSTSSDDHIMTVIKDWQTDDFDRNYTKSYSAMNDPYGGTNDDFAIMNASAQLLKRPEKQKMLIVISDGESAHPDFVKKAVKYSRKNGIFLVSLFIGTPRTIANKRAAFEDLYEKYYSCCTPDELADVIVTFLKKFIRNLG